MSQTPKQREANRTRWRAEADLPPDDESMLRLSAPIDLEDLRKARWYLDREIARLELEPTP